MKTIKTCRACGSSALTPVFSTRKKTNNKSGRAAKKNQQADPDQFVLCDPSINALGCGLVQRANPSGNSQSNSPSAQYRTVSEHLRAAAIEALEMISGRDCAALDIGCNDGTLLSYYPRWVERFGVDIDEIVDTVGDWAWTARSAFPSQELDKAFGSKCFDIISCINVFEELEDPAQLLAAVKKRLLHDGVFVLETKYAPMILTGNLVECLSENVSAVYTLGVLEQLIRDHDMKIFRGSLTSRDGGSVRLFITHTENNEYDFDPWSERLARLWDEETVLAMRDQAPYQAFIQRCATARERLLKNLEGYTRNGDSIHLIGVNPAAQSLLQWVDPDHSLISHIVAYSPREEAICSSQQQNLPLISAADSEALEPACYLAPASLKREILETWREPIMNGSEIIFASPEPHVVNAMNYSTEYGKTLSVGDSGAGVETLRAILHAAGGPRLISETQPAAKSA